VTAVKTVEETALLLPVRLILARVQVDGDALDISTEASALPRDYAVHQGVSHGQQLAFAHAALEPGEGRL